jgi:hypothetical protein
VWVRRNNVKNDSVTIIDTAIQSRLASLTRSLPWNLRKRLAKLPSSVGMGPVRPLLFSNKSAKETQNGLDGGRGVGKKEYRQERQCYNNRYSNTKQTSIINKVLAVELTKKISQASKLCRNGTGKTIIVKDQVCEGYAKWIRWWS